MTVVSPMHQLTMGQVGGWDRVKVSCFSRASFALTCFLQDEFFTRVWSHSLNIKFKASGDRTSSLCEGALRLLASKADTENYKQPGMAPRHPDSLSSVSFPGPSKLGHLK